jgi:hypothetical protein
MFLTPQKKLSECGNQKFVAPPTILNPACEKRRNVNEPV